jgi:hypothetical protein
LTQQRFLACAPADEALRMVEGTTFDRKCSQCETRVLVAPSGRAALARNPEMILICYPCAVAAMDRHGNPIIELAASAAEIAREVGTAQPNIWRKRN